MEQRQNKRMPFLHIKEKVAVFRLKSNCRFDLKILKMKGLLVLLSAAVIGICMGEVFDDKQDAVREISARFADAERLKNNILKTISNEKTNMNLNGENELLNHLRSKVEETSQQFERDSGSVIKSAIIKAKPIQVFHCIRNVTSVGVAVIEKQNGTYLQKVLNIRRIKYEKIDFDEYAVQSIMSALDELVSQAIEKITHTTGPIDTLKKQALSNCESASLLLGEIEVTVHEPILNKEYVKMRQEIDRNFRTLATALNTDLEKCLDAKPKY